MQKIYKIKNKEGGVDTFETNLHAKGKERYKLNGKSLTGVTTALGVINKPALLGWSARCAYEDALGIINEAIKENKTFTHLKEVVSLILKEKKYAHTIKSRSAMDKGTVAHAWVEDWAKAKMLGQEIELPKDEETARIIRPFLEWIEGKKKVSTKKNTYDKHSIAISPKSYKVLASEQSVVSKNYRYSGTFDLVLEIDGKKYVCDFKTSSGIYGREYFAQCSAYRNALEEMGWGDDIVGSIIIRSGKEGDDFEVALSTEYKADFKFFRCALGIYKEGYIDFDIE